MDELENVVPKYIIDNLKRFDYEEYKVTEEMIDLADKYMESEIITKKYYGNGLHNMLS